MTYRITEANGTIEIEAQSFGDFAEAANDPSIAGGDMYKVIDYAVRPSGSEVARIHRDLHIESRSKGGNDIRDAVKVVGSDIDAGKRGIRASGAARIERFHKWFADGHTAVMIIKRR